MTSVAILRFAVDCRRSIKDPPGKTGLLDAADMGMLKQSCLTVIKGLLVQS